MFTSWRDFGIPGRVQPTMQGTGAVARAGLTAFW